MDAPNWMAYSLIGGVVVISFVVPAIVGFGDAWFVPLVVIPFAALYGVFDWRLRHQRGE
jgi:hypothetical protein